jgi:hypothetical protein
MAALYVREADRMSVSFDRAPRPSPHVEAGWNGWRTNFALTERKGEGFGEKRKTIADAWESGGGGGSCRIIFVS